MNSILHKKSPYLRRIVSLVGLLFIVITIPFLVQKAQSLGPDIQGAGYRLFATSTSTTPGTPLAATNTSAQLTTGGQTFRLRTGITTRPNAVEITAIDGGYGVSCAIVSGLVYCSGQNTKGELGNGDTSGAATTTFGPVDTSTGLAGKTATELAIGPLANTHVHVCAVADQQLYCWGSNNFTALGIDQSPTVVPTSFTPVASVMSDSMAGELVKQIDSGDGHLCGVTVSGKGFCQGTGGNGRLGDGTTSTRRKPTEVSMTGVLAGKFLTKMTALSASSCVIASGAAYCWGNGNLGDGTSLGSVNPVAVDTNVSTSAVAGKTLVDITSTTTTVCVLDTAGRAYCWGANSSREVGDNSASGTVRLSPVAVNMSLVAGGEFSSIAGKQEHVCGIGKLDALLYCWGSNNQGDTARGLSGGTTDQPTQVTITASLSGKSFTYTGSGRNTTCAVASNIGYCAGYNVLGSLGFGNVTSPVTTLTPVLTTNFVAAQGVTIAANTLSSRLEYAQKTAATCSIQTGFAAVTTSTPIAWSVNGSVTSGTTITSSGNDPYSGSTTTLESYVSATANFTNPVSIVPGNSGLWDFSLEDNSGLYNQAFCVRIAQNSGTAYTSYSSYPEIMTAPGVLSVGFVNASNVPIAAPTVTMPSTTINTQCQTVAGSLSDSSRKLRVGNDSSVASWGLSIAATSGASAIWQHESQAYSYDYNDSSGSPAGCFAGSDGDIVAGQLTVQPAAAGVAITPKSGCSNTGVSLSSDAAFQEGTVNAISIANASSSAGMLCYWDITNVGLSQKIPPSQAGGIYTVDLTLTVIAQ